MGIPDHLTCLLRNLYAGQEATVRTEHGTGSKSGKEYIKAVYCHLAYLIYIQSTSYKMLGWMKHKLESRLLGEISITSDMQITPPLGLPWWLRRQSIRLQCGRPGFDPWVRKIPWRRKWQPTPVLLPGEFHGQKSLVGYSPWGRKESDMTEWLHLSNH